ncbi:hypothetical protein JAAARDRAFT_62207 [Jaapia argillacea MUCL 33604]|uniref:Amidohydrolase-related domain-containing protein n=1 Tax=Jaapia argillacea MUCL 33604 TaxID=933084 RepID=A0A067PA90_9AGAM|nr:hypothetical protein JAAARDRAFT_62207 [Jaapia argillacea MUCL 33604]
MSALTLVSTGMRPFQPLNTLGRSCSRMDYWRHSQRTIVQYLSPSRVESTSSSAATKSWLFKILIPCRTSRMRWSSIVRTNGLPPDSLTLIGICGCRLLTTKRIGPSLNTALVTAEDVYAGQLAGCLQALHSGTTAVVDHFHCANSVEHIEKAIEATAESGLRCMLCISRQSLPSSFEPFAFGNDAQVSKMQLDIIQSLAQEDQGRLTPDGRVTLGLAYDVQGYDPQEDQRILTLVRDLNVKPITLHYVGGPHGRAFSKKIRLWAEAGLLKEDVIFSHANDLLHEGCDPGEWDLLKASGASTASTPEDELGMGHGSPVAYEAVRRGVKVGLGIDCASIVSTEMFPAMRVALQCERGRLHKVRADDGKGVKYNSLSAASAFRLATLGGAETAHVETQIGSIEVGKLADIVLYNADSVNLSNCSNCSDPFRGIVLHATAEDVQWVFVNGEIVKRDGKLLRKEWSGVAENLKTRAAVIKEKVANFDLEQRYASIDKQFGLALEV